MKKVRQKHAGSKIQVYYSKVGYAVVIWGVAPLKDQDDGKRLLLAWMLFLDNVKSCQVLPFFKVSCTENGCLSV